MTAATTLDRIPFVNLGRQLERLRPELVAAFEAVLDSRGFIKGPHVAAFEAAFAAAIGARPAVGCANGTAAVTAAAVTASRLSCSRRTAARSLASRSACADRSKLSARPARARPSAMASARRSGRRWRRRASAPATRCSSPP